MIHLWFSLIVLLLLSFVFIAWPLWRYRGSANGALIQNDVDASFVENVRIFREHLNEIESNFASGAIDIQQFSQLKLELERSLLEDETSLRAQHKTSSQRLGVKVVIGFCVLVLAVGVWFYQQHGSVRDVYIQQLQTEKLQQDYQNMIQNRDPNPSLTQALIHQYEARVKDHPENVQYWFLLARTQMEVGNFTEAVKAYQQVLTRDSDSAMIMAELAQAVFLRDGNKITPPVADLAKKAVMLDPKNTIALGLLGIDAYSHKDYRATIRYWQKSVDLLGADSPSGHALSAGIEKAKQSFVAAGGKLDDLTVKSAYVIEVAVSLGANVKANSDQVVFVYARAWHGSPMPLAIARIKVGDLPATIQLDETMAMSPASSLATATDVEVVARISSSGSAKAEVGDWLVKQGPISMKAIPKILHLEFKEQLTAKTVEKLD